MIIQKSLSAPYGDKLTINDFQIKGLLAEGSYAEVFQAFDLRTQTMIALKRLHKKKIVDMGKKQEIYMEKLILQLYTEKCKGMIHFHGAFQDEDFLYFAIDFCPYGDFDSFIQGAHLLDEFPEDLIKYYLVQIVSILIYLHGRGVAHLDLKPSNLVIDENNDLKLIDFATCYLFDKSQRPLDYFTPLSHKYKKILKPDDSPEILKSRFVGTAQYISPEMLDKSKASKEADLWSLGVLIYEIYHNKYPFDSDSEITIFDNILKLKYQIQQNTPEQAKDLIEKLLVLEPEKRLGAVQTADILRHPYFQSLQQYNPWEQKIPVIEKYFALYRRKVPKLESMSTDSPFKTLTEFHIAKEGKDIISPLHLIQTAESKISLIQLKPIQTEQETTEGNELQIFKEDYGNSTVKQSSIKRNILISKLSMAYEKNHCLPTLAFCQLLSNPFQLRIKYLNKNKIIFETDPQKSFQLSQLNQRKYIIEGNNQQQIFYDCEIQPFNWIKLVQMKNKLS